MFPPCIGRRRWIAAAAACCATAFAQSPTTIVITGNPLGRAEAMQPASVLAGDGLLLRRAATLGETLDGLPGVASTWFGPNAVRPVIRGLDGDRIRVLEGGGASVDVSSLSFDHAVAIDPLLVERIEVLRGPAALLYGGSATGGVVNLLDNRVPKAPIAGLAGRAELRAGGAASERSGALVLEGGLGSLVWHADAFARGTSDLKAPLAGASRVINSASDAHGGAVGGGFAGRDGFFGVAIDSYRSRYGVVLEPEVTIEMERERATLAGQRRFDGAIRRLDIVASRTRYRHQEFEGPEVGTTFSSRGSDARIELQHAPLGPLAGVVGVQWESLRFSALGEEAFVPGTRTRSTAAFVLEELSLGSATLSAGLRSESVRVASDGDAPDAEAPRFGAAVERQFSPVSLALSATGPLVPGWRWNASLGRTERAPAYYELYANGLHIATGAFEVGDPTLEVERSRHAELGLAWSDARTSLKASWFHIRFARFISLDATGETVLVEPEEEGGEAEELPVFAFRPVPARLTGFEIEAKRRLVDGGGWTLDGQLSIDRTRAHNLASGEPLPRIAPLRMTAAIDAARGPWRFGVRLRHAAGQDRVPATDSATAGWTLLDLWASAGTKLGSADALWFVRLDNATDRLAFNASTIGTLRAASPLPGRSLSAGVRVSF